MQSRILVVDDDEITRRNIEKMLAEDGYHVSTAKDTEKAFELLNQETFSLIILDMIMPDWTGKLSERAGVDILKKIKNNNPDTPVILFSANEQVKLVVEAINLGATDYLITQVLR